MSDFLRPAGGHIGNLRSGPILAVLMHSFYARRNRLFTKRSKNSLKIEPDLRLTQRAKKGSRSFSMTSLQYELNGSR